MNPGILTPPTQFATLPRGLLGRPTPVPMINARLVFDADAERYLAAVESADGAPLERAVRDAVSDFVIGCKQDGIWNAIQTSAILMGARTLAGALTPLVGRAPTNNNFVSGDYNRKTGLIGNGSTKYLNSNRNNNADPQNDFHMSVYVTATTAAGWYMGDVASGNVTVLERFSADHFAYARTSSFLSSGTAGTGFFGTGRTASNAWNSRSRGTNYTATSNSVAPSSRNIFVFAGNGTSGAWTFSPNRISFYSIGQSLTLATLDSRVTTLYNAIQAAIP